MAISPVWSNGLLHPLERPAAMPVLADKSGWFTIDVPAGWDRQTLDSVTTLRSPTGVGTVYFSGGRHAAGRRRSFGRADFLARFLLSLGIVVEPECIEHTEGRDCQIFSCRRDSGGAHWRYWSVTDDETALLVSYTCDCDDSQLESEEVDGIVHSIRLRHSSSVH